MAKPLLVFKYGGNAMTNPQLRREAIKHICNLTNEGYRIVIVHGGGPFIQAVLDKSNISSEFVDGHRKTSSEAIDFVEMALKGNVNGQLVAIAGNEGYKAVGLSGKDGQIVRAKKRLHKREVDGKVETVDLGQVGDVDDINTNLIHLLIDSGYIPIITCIATSADGQTMNINADMFAGHLAGALNAEKFIVLTDVDGLFRDINDPSTLIESLSISELPNLEKSGIIQGGMIPKLEACRIAVDEGAREACIINGTKPPGIGEWLKTGKGGTTLQNA